MPANSLLVALLPLLTFTLKAAPYAYLPDCHPAAAPPACACGPSTPRAATACTLRRTAVETAATVCNVAGSPVVGILVSLMVLVHRRSIPWELTLALMAGCAFSSSRKTR